jgi:staphylococcal nuclease domain-containing protein 1
VGNIAEFLLGAGLAHFVEWHSGMLAPYGGSEKLRAADRAAKEKRIGLHANAATAPALSKSISGTANGMERTFEGSVIRIWSGDQISVLNKDNKERRVQLSSTRGPKCVLMRTLDWTLITWWTGCQTQSRRITHMKPVNFLGKG